MKDFAKQFYYSAAWRKCRKTYISMRMAIDGGMCERCHEHPGYIIHHIQELTPDNIHDPDIALSPGNLMYVCHDCHNIIHGYTAQLPKRAVQYVFGADGQPVAVGTPHLKQAGGGSRQPPAYLGKIRRLYE